MAESDTATSQTIEINEVMKRIPHRYPFLMVDRVVNFVPYEGAIGIKNVSINEPHFQGHFPERPIMPGVLIVESMAQTAGVVVVSSLGTDAEGKLVYFMSVEEAKFRRPVEPGDQLQIHVTRKQNRGPVWKFEGRATVDGTLVAEAVFTAMIKDAE
ncbi:3-hydroxyacyl-ACP dehydratase FabZ [Hwanghaeella grinnelliae]|uniref:3-hydroxyacyl-[acyl-carrier-protein] dehydratase FabZ n=1 Tax=Hwanghaeella grinnelliae TaxID=2500179 RepID=A0A437QXT6_9PROT|nr:3-hydroxyacyl-ACP dehydratase FabZ [Hwanghaeella grinnelliae]RVU39328.1 3-hydroxyacyl-ACP dehydratase FabZ [Hwanghaeella grinnelliae]